VPLLFPMPPLLVPDAVSMPPVLRLVVILAGGPVIEADPDPDAVGAAVGLGELEESSFSCRTTRVSSSGSHLGHAIAETEDVSDKSATTDVETFIFFVVSFRACLFRKTTMVKRL
jgi:hypothetical protein